MNLAELVAEETRRMELEFAKQAGVELEQSALERWARDPLGWINEHVWIASFLGAAEDSVRTRIRPVRMSLYPDQAATIAAWIDLEHLQATGRLRFRNVLIEKSRQIGETVALAAALEWVIQHHRVDGMCMHQKIAKIDDGGPRSTWRSMFGKVRYIDRHLDRSQVRYPQLVFKQKPSKIENPVNGSIVYGEGQDDDSARGDSLDFAILDEASRIMHGESVHAALDDACPDGKLYLSTPWGDSNMHSRLCDERPAGYSYLRLHWATHPVYGRGSHIAGQDPGCELCEQTRLGVQWSAREPVAHRYPGKLTSPWYDQAVVGKTNEQVAGELDIDRAGALSARVYAEFEDALHVVADGIAYDPALPVELAWDFGLDVNPIVVIQDTVEEVRVIGLLECGDVAGTSGTPTAVSAELIPYLQSLGLEDVSLPALLRIRCIGDPEGQYRSRTTGQPYVDGYRTFGFEIERPPSYLTARVDYGITSVKLLLAGTPKPVRVCGVNAAEFATHMRNNVWPMDASGQRRLGVTTPLDNHHNHAPTAFRYWAVTKYPPPTDHGPATIHRPNKARLVKPRHLTSVGAV